MIMKCWHAAAGFPNAAEILPTFASQKRQGTQFENKCQDV